MEKPLQVPFGGRWLCVALAVHARNDDDLTSRRHYDFLTILQQSNENVAAVNLPNATKVGS